MPDSDVVLQRLDQQDHVLHEIKVQVSETNGRVRKLELWQAHVLGAKAAVSWVPPAVTAIASAVIGAGIMKLLGL